MYEPRDREVLTNAARNFESLLATHANRLMDQSPTAAGLLLVLGRRVMHAHTDFMLALGPIAAEPAPPPAAKKKKPAAAPASAAAAGGTAAPGAVGGCPKNGGKRHRYEEFAGARVCKHCQNPDPRAATAATDPRQTTVPGAAP